MRLNRKLSTSKKRANRLMLTMSIVKNGPCARARCGLSSKFFGYLLLLEAAWLRHLQHRKHSWSDGRRQRSRRDDVASRAWYSAKHHAVAWCHWSPTVIRVDSLPSIWLWVAWWRNGRASDLRSRGREFDSRPGRGCVATLGKLFTPNCLDANTLR